MYFRVEHKATDATGRSLGFPLPPHGDKLDLSTHRQSLYRIVQDRSARTGETYRQIVEAIAGDDGPDPAFTTGSKAFWEHLFERVRLQYHTQLPSRLTCVFALPSLEQALALAETFERESRDALSPRLYRISDRIVIALRCVEPQFNGCFDMTHFTDMTADLAHAEAVERARAYWRGDQSKAPILECLLTGDVFRGEIVRRF